MQLLLMQIPPWMTAAEDAPDVAGLECTGKLKLDYATGFDAYITMKMIMH